MKKIILILVLAFFSQTVKSQTASYVISGNNIVTTITACNNGSYALLFFDEAGNQVASVGNNYPQQPSNQPFTFTLPIPSGLGCNGSVKVQTKCNGTFVNHNMGVFRPFYFTWGGWQNNPICSGTALNISLATATNIPSTIQWKADNDNNVTGESWMSWKTGNINDVLVNTTSTAQSVSYNMTATTNHYGVSCSSISSYNSVGVHPSNPTPPTVSVYQGDTALCTGKSAKLYHSVATNVGYNTPLTWSNGSTSNPLTVNQIGSYSVSATNACGTFTSNVVNVVPVNLQVNATASNSSILCGQTTTLTANVSSASNISYSWLPSNSLTGTTTATPTAKPTSTTTYNVTVQTPNGCTAYDTITITVNPAHQVNVSATKTAIMCGDSTQLQASVTGNVSNVNYSWLPYSSSVITGANTATPIATPKSTTSYIVSASTSDGCIAKDTIVITVNPYQVNASATKTLISCGGSTELHATSNNSNAVYSWSPSSSLTNANTANPAASPTSTTTYTVSSSVTGCGTATDNITITVDAYTPQLFTHTTNELTATFTNTEENAVSYAWNFGDGNTSTSENPTHTYATDGTYNVCLTLTNTCSETETVCANVTVTKEVGVQNIAAQATWSVYPNPTNSTFTVANAPNGASLSITDLSGKTVYTSRIVSEQTSIETFTSGIYFVNVMFEGVTTMHKVVVTK
ncbi:MAG TPA: PKD domain-containing protein [Crocinitomicaceae bacterium]|nr:PKD domain-containing protein [Crocinitomicaceae bacterium]